MSPSERRRTASKLASQRQFMITAAGNKSYAGGKLGPNAGMVLDKTGYQARTRSNQVKNKQLLILEKLRRLGF